MTFDGGTCGESWSRSSGGGGPDDASRPAGRLWLSRNLRLRELMVPGVGAGNMIIQAGVAGIRIGDRHNVSSPVTLNRPSTHPREPSW